MSSRPDRIHDVTLRSGQHVQLPEWQDLTPPVHGDRMAVSYTHLDVYKRQSEILAMCVLHAGGSGTTGVSRGTGSTATGASAGGVAESQSRRGAASTNGSAVAVIASASMAAGTNGGSLSLIHI